MITRTYKCKSCNKEFKTTVINDTVIDREHCTFCGSLNIQRRFYSISNEISFHTYKSNIDKEE